MDEKTYREVCDWLLEIEESGYEFPTENAARFIKDTRARIDQYGQRTTMSDKQLEWLERLHQQATE